VVLLAGGIALGALAGVDAPGLSDAAILERIGSGRNQAAAGLALPMLASASALLLWFAVGLRRALERLEGDEPLLHAIVPAAALFAGLVIVGAAIDVSSAVTALATDAFTPDPEVARVLGTAGATIGLTGLVGGAVMVAATTRIAQRAQALPTWAVWASYVVVVLCLIGFWTAGMGSVALGLWLVGAVIALLRASRS
jgi:hypothetical protein